MIRALAVAMSLLAAGALAHAPARAATLVHSNDLLGDIEPCGCRTNPLGGMARKANWLKTLGDASILQLDAGDLLFASNELPELLKAQGELQARYLLKSMDQVHHDAVVPGEKDFALGLQAFDKLRKATRIHFLAANLVRKNGQAYLPKSRVFERKTSGGKRLKIAVIGLVGDDLPFPHGLKTLPAIATAKREVAAALKSKADLIVLLTHQGLERDQELAAAVPEIDVIVGGHTQSFLQTPLKVGKTTIYQSSFRNQYVGAIPLAQPGDYKLTGLDVGYESPADKPTPTDKLIKEFKKALGELNAKADAKLEKLTSAQNTPGTTKFHTFPKCAECHLKQFDFWRKTQHAIALSTLIDKQQYQNKECLGCHTVGLGDKQGFRSVNRIAEYKHAPRTEPSSLPSPTENFAYSGEEPAIDPLGAPELATYLKAMHDAPSLKAPARITPLEPETTLRRSISQLHVSWAPVQCENCHQPGREHPFSGTYTKTVDKTACLKCHTEERAPEWYAKGKPNWAKIEAKRALITCPAGNLSEQEDGQ